MRPAPIATRRRTAIACVLIAVAACSARNLLRLLRLHASVPWFWQDSTSTQLKKGDGARDSVAVDVAFNRTEICHVTANFGAGIDNTDQLYPIPRELHSLPFRHVLFTNLPSMDAKGREVILLPDDFTSDLSYKRMITWSRWPKFVGWRHPSLASCKYIAYSDAVATPRGTCNLTCWESLGALSRNASYAPGGVVQDLRPQHLQLPLTEELKRLVKNKKDVAKNVDATIQWLQQQPDFRDSCPVSCRSFCCCLIHK